MTAIRGASNISPSQCRKLAARHAAGETWRALAEQLGLRDDAVRQRVRDTMARLPDDEPRGHGRPPLRCGCTDGQRCEEAERLWAAMQEAGKRVFAKGVRLCAPYNGQGTVYQMAHHAYIAHLAANRVQAVRG